ncbi:hypothetical protein LTR91_005878 [Friedmanniomyces endolithicus]|uniref:Inheritance of peroxisomes protein 1 n=1 Tax=Friedmanniomyces endolithicus TaxID=329885 RepID=A0AAN6KUM3_9PEZI|nr:hypothetical protein LTR94_016816 [Friedmanniomyces endolithicus]KAK0779123.1 hypothetical protein LTR59_013256 [Friedmanniomyces endolithicus]KAK0780127.1 hypothetical protein LTR38_014197 [Friedmanniomyces endolithicus]KAK0841700.1 hypothetical protein LTR03_009713 [Friedmanniomyces endolithicus]KAK0914094.1 hypothetical protein LTR57_014152 [Friedmanniomyces endolithicus]
MSSANPSTPSAPRRIAMNRSFTVPSRLTTTTTAAQANPSVEIGATKDVETLYVHPNASIVKFSIAPSSRPSTSSSSSPRPLNTSTSAGLLPWTSRTERTLASGPLEIYRVPGSVSFLHSGALLHAILPRSQCWCVDGVSKFTMRVLPDTYYRIELPANTSEDVEKVEELKRVLAKVLFYERTACPFDRGLEEVKPTADELRERRQSRRVSLGPAKRWRLEGRYSWRPEGGGSVGTRGEGWAETEEMEESEEEYGEVEDTGAKADKARDGFAGGLEQLSVQQQTLARPRELAAMRSITAPPQLTSLNHPTPGTRDSMRLTGTAELPEPISVPRPQREPTRLRTFQPMPTDMPPSPPDSSAGLELAEAHVRRQNEKSEAGAETCDIEEELQGTDEQSMKRQDAVPPHDELPEQEPAPVTPAPAHHRHTDITAQRPPSPTQQVATGPRKAPPSRNEQTLPEDPFAAIQARILARRSIGSNPPTPKHTSSPPKPASPSSSSSTSLASRTSHSSASTTRPHLSRSQSTQHNLASALVHKACAVFLGPPAQLVAIMLKIAARLTGDTLAFGASFVFQSPAGSKRVPGSFDLESLDAEDLEGMEGAGEGEEEEEEEEGEDDFGVPLRSPVRLANVGRVGRGAEWSGGGGGVLRDRREGVQPE